MYGEITVTRQARLYPRFRVICTMAVVFSKFRVYRPSQKVSSPMRKTHKVVTFFVALALLLSACSSDESGPLTIYSGRTEDLIGPLVEQFEAETGIDVEVRYGDSTDLASTILLEGDASPADVFLAQDPASLGLVALAGLFSPLPTDLTDQVPTRFSAPDRSWVGISGRARTVVVNLDTLDAPLPESIWDLADPAYAGLAIAPTNGSFLAFVAALILEEGEDKTREWLEAIAANSPSDYPKNSPIVQAVDSGEVSLGLVNHYYLLRLEAEQGSVTASNHFLSAGDAGSLVMPSGAGILDSSNRSGDAEAFIRFMLSETAQQHFATETFEYPLVEGFAADPRLVPLDEIPTPSIDLSRLAEALDRATQLVAEAGLI